MFAKRIRLERIIDRNSKKAVIVPLDHGLSSGPLPGLVDLRSTVDKISKGGATSVLMHKGQVHPGHRGYGKDIGLIIHLTAGAILGSDPYSQVTVTTVEEAIALGADAVSIQINLGANTSDLMIENAGVISRVCREWGMPLLAMIYPRGPAIKNEFDPDAIKICARTAAELGADLVKTNYTGNPDTFREVTKGANIPVLIAGGPKMNTDTELLNMVRDAVNAGAGGVCLGRNIFQHTDIEGITSAISAIVLNDASVEDALKYINAK